jgi:hypothetical protein
MFLKYVASNIQVMIGVGMGRIEGNLAWESTFHSPMGENFVPYKFTFERSWRDGIQDVIVALLWDSLISLLDLVGVLVYMLIHVESKRCHE